MITLMEIQARFESALIAISQQTPMDPRTIPEEVKLLAQSFKQRPRLPNVKVKPEDLVMAMMNILVMASEVGVDLEQKVLEVLSAMEQPSYFSS